MVWVNPHGEIESVEVALPDWKAVAQQAAGDREVLSAAPLVQAQAMLVRGEAVRGALISGIDPVLEPTVSDIAHHLQGAPIDALVAGRFGIVLGRDLAHALGVEGGGKGVWAGGTERSGLAPAGHAARPTGRRAACAAARTAGPGA